MNDRIKECIDKNWVLFFIFEQKIEKLIKKEVEYILIPFDEIPRIEGNIDPLCDSYMDLIINLLKEKHEIIIEYTIDRKNPYYYKLQIKK